MNYLFWLQLLVSLGQNLGPILDAVEALYNLVAAAVPKNAVTDGLEMVDLSAEEQAAEAQVAALVAGPNAAFDGSRLRRLFKFLKDSGGLEWFKGLVTSG